MKAIVLALFIISLPDLFAQGTNGAISPAAGGQAGEYLRAAAELSTALQASSAAFAKVKLSYASIQGNGFALPESKEVTAAELKRLGLDPAFLDGLQKELPSLPLGVQARPAIVLDRNSPYEMNDSTTSTGSTGTYSKKDPIVYSWTNDSLYGTSLTQATQAVDSMKKLLKKVLDTDTYTRMLANLGRIASVSWQLDYLIEVTARVSN